MLCRNIAAGWNLSVQRGRAKASILRALVAGVMTDWTLGRGRICQDIRMSGGFWGINDESWSMAPHRRAGGVLGKPSSSFIAQLGNHPPGTSRE
jgi:hypothetical protein